MAELVFIAATIFVAYTLFTMIGDKKDLPSEEKASTPEVKEPNEIAASATPVSPSAPAARKRAASAKAVTKAPAEKAAPAKAPAKPKVTAEKAAAKPKAVAEKKPATRTRASKAAVPVANIDSLKNPKTGEVVKIPNSYAFAKRWVKDALVEEKLLDKVYKNTELDDATNAKILVAIDKLKQMPKYQ